MVNIKSNNNLDFPPLLHLTYDLQQLSDKNLHAVVGVGLGQVRIMSVLHQNAAHSQRTVSLLLHQTEANVSRQLQLLKKKGMVSITKNKKDARQRDVKLTVKGAKALGSALKTLNTQQKNLMKLVSTKDQQAVDRAAANLMRATNNKT